MKGKPMKAVHHEKFGEPAEVVAAADYPTPVAGAGQVLVRMVLAPIHNHDLWTIRGEYGVKPALPAIAGSEATGIIEAVGEGVDAALIGTRVAAGGVPRAWAEYFLADAAGVVPVPEAMTDEAAAQLIAMPFSAITLLEFLNVEAGDWVVQTAANGAVGKIMAALAKSRDIKLLNLVRRPEAVAELTGMGIENVISTSDTDWVAKAKAIIGAAGARAAVDSVGGDIVPGLTELLGQKALLVTFGTATGGDMQLPSGAVIFKELTVKGFWGHMVAAEMPVAERMRLFGELVGLVMDGSLELTSGGTFTIDQAREAMQAAVTPGRPGKIMLRP
jgi:NADPH2:quinone reductase